MLSWFSRRREQKEREKEIEEYQNFMKDYIAGRPMPEGLSRKEAKEFNLQRIKDAAKAWKQHKGL
jgi:hypothetical protein